MKKYALYLFSSLVFVACKKDNTVENEIQIDKIEFNGEINALSGTAWQPIMHGENQLLAFGNTEFMILKSSDWKEAYTNGQYEKGTYTILNNTLLLSFNNDKIIKYRLTNEFILTEINLDGTLSSKKYEQQNQRSIGIVDYFFPLK